MLARSIAGSERIAFEGVTLLGLHSAVSVRATGDDIRLEAPFCALLLRSPGQGMRDALAALATAPRSLDELAALVMAADGPDRLTALFFHLDTLARKGLLRHVVHADGVPLMAIEATARGFAFAPVDLAAFAPLRLSRFTLLRRAGDEMVAENPLGQATVTLFGAEAFAVLHTLTRPIAFDELGTLPDTTIACLHLLAVAGLLDRGADGDRAEDADPQLRQWAFHDLLFHARSRFGRHGGPFGATFRHAGLIDPLPAVRPRAPGSLVALPRPDIAMLERSDPPLQHVIETRRSIYEYGDAPIARAQLGEFLFRVARVRTCRAMPLPGSAVAMPTSSRPYPSGGKSYELEFYLTIAACDGLAPGLYHYDPLDHALTRLDADPVRVGALLDYCMIAAPGCRPQVLVTLAARFQRVSWKYDAIAYATTLKHVGVVYQTMYLVATAMGLAASALGSGDPDAFAAAAGTDWLAETSVGEFILGSMPVRREADHVA